MNFIDDKTISKMLEIVGFTEVEDREGLLYNLYYSIIYNSCPDDYYINRYVDNEKCPNDCEDCWKRAIDNYDNRNFNE